MLQRVVLNAQKANTSVESFIYEVCYYLYQACFYLFFTLLAIYKKANFTYLIYRDKVKWKWANFIHFVIWEQMIQTLTTK